MSQGQLDILPNAGHFAPQLQSQAVVGSLQHFLDGPETASSNELNTPEVLDKQ